MPDVWSGIWGAGAYAATSRDTPQPTDDYWTIHLIGAFREVTPHALGGYANNTVFVFNDTIKDAIDADPSFNLTHFNEIMRRTVLHEIGHSLNLEDESGLGVMRSPSTLQQRVNTLYRSFTPDNIKIIQQPLKPQ